MVVAMILFLRVFSAPHRNMARPRYKTTSAIAEISLSMPREPLKYNKGYRGQILAEVLVAGGVFSVIIASILGLVLDSYRATTGGGEDTQAMFLAQEGLDAAKAIRDVAWTNLTVGSH